MGRVTDVTGNAAMVTLITDHTSGVSAKVAHHAAITGVVKPAVGNPNDLLLDFVPRGARVVRGHARRHRGHHAPAALESLFPADIPIGDGHPGRRRPGRRCSSACTCAPYANLRTLDFVQVLTGRLDAAHSRPEVP